MPSNASKPYTIKIAGQNVTYARIENPGFPWIRCGNRQADPFPNPGAGYMPTADDYYKMWQVMRQYQDDHPNVVRSSSGGVFAMKDGRIYVGMSGWSDQRMIDYLEHALPEEAFTCADVHTMVKMFDGVE